MYFLNTAQKIPRQISDNLKKEKVGHNSDEDLIKALDEAMILVTKKNLHNWFTHCRYCKS